MEGAYDHSIVQPGPVDQSINGVSKVCLSFTTTHTNHRRRRGHHGVLAILEVVHVLLELDEVKRENRLPGAQGSPVICGAGARNTNALIWSCAAAIPHNGQGSSSLESNIPVGVEAIQSREILNKLPLILHVMTN